MSDVKSIDTFYNGYRFRSRLEARWAVFFDHAFIDYQYEPEGFLLSDGSCYLPDFYLPLFRMYVEIKPTTISSEELVTAENKMVQLFNGEIFSEKGKGITVALFQGDPIENINWIYCKAKLNNEYSCGWYPMKFIKGCYGNYRGKRYSFKKNVTTVSVYCNNIDTFFSNSAFDKDAMLINANEITGCVSTFKSAKLRARQARFEFGECG